MPNHTVIIKSNLLSCAQSSPMKIAKKCLNRSTPLALILFHWKSVKKEGQWNRNHLEARSGSHYNEYAHVFSTVRGKESTHRSLYIGDLNLNFNLNLNPSDKSDQKMGFPNRKPIFIRSIKGVPTLGHGSRPNHLLWASLGIGIFCCFGLCVRYGTYIFHKWPRIIVSSECVHALISNRLSINRSAESGRQPVCWVEIKSKWM